MNPKHLFKTSEVTMETDQAAPQIFCTATYKQQTSQSYYGTLCQACYYIDNPMLH